MIATVGLPEEMEASPGVGETRTAQFARARAALRLAGVSAPVAAGFFVPGRIEVLGKHTDYAGGRSLLCAVERGFAIVAAPRPDHLIHIINADSGKAVTCGIDPALVPKLGHWSNYPATVVRRLARNFEAFDGGADVAFTSDLPPAAGMSSSSSLLIAVFLAVAEVNDLAASPAYAEAITSTEDLASYLACIENGQSFRGLTGDTGVGTSGGSEDHTAILCSRPGALAQYRFAPVCLERRISLGDGLAFVVASSGVPARKTGDAREVYNRASRLASRVLSVWHEAKGAGAASLQAAVEERPEAREEMRLLLAGAGTDEYPAAALLDRFDQFCVESLELIPAAGDALERGDLRTFGSLVDASQLAAERWLRNQVPETVTLARLAREQGAWAASAFGAGFGGSVWALVRRDEAARFAAGWAQSYAAQFPAHAARGGFLVSRPGPAAYRVAWRD